MRQSLLRLVTILGAALFTITELLSTFGRLQRTPLEFAWFLVAAGMAAALIRRRSLAPIHWPGPDAVVLLCAAACVGIVVLTGLTAIVSPPNSSDAMAYHMPRVVYWAEQSGVRFFPTPYLNQIMLQPFAEYAMLHLYVLSGGDHFINLVQWFASLISILAVSLAAGQLGAPSRGQAIAALFCATLPAGILASSGAKNDYVLAMWMAIAVCFAIRFASTSAIADGLFLGAATGLALLTKATAYLFLPFLIGAVLAAQWRPRTRRAALPAAAAIACALFLNTPHWVRNFQLSGSVMGFDSAQANGFFRWRNETFGWKQTVSNMVRNASEQLGARSPRWNQAIYDAAVSIHQRLGIDINDPATTWRWSKFGPPANANHEANAANRWHVLLLLAIGVTLALRASRARDRARALYLTALLAGFVLFSAYLKWQPFMARLFLPLLVAAAPTVSLLGEIRPAASRWPALAIQVPLCLLLVTNARLPLLQNWTRPLQGPASILRIPRDDQYFTDMRQWDNRASYRQSADLLARTQCGTVGIDINNLQLEYPLMALLRERLPSVQFLHTAVANPSQSYPPPVATPPCAIACLDCASDTTRLSIYRGFRQSAAIGKFVILYRDRLVR